MTVVPTNDRSIASTVIVCTLVHAVGSLRVENGASGTQAYVHRDGLTPALPVLQLCVSGSTTTTVGEYDPMPETCV
jgi:hypothetical protein